MVRRRLGRTGLAVSPISFGSFKIGRNQKTKYAQSYDLPGDAEVERLLNGVLDLGINLIDTAPAYGASEERIGRAISRRRSEFMLSTKVGEVFAGGQSTYDFSMGAVIQSIHRSLLRLRTEVLDFAFLHSNGDDMAILKQADAVRALRVLRDEGVIRFIGMSGKTVEGARAAMGWADALMVEYHTADESHEAVIGEAAERGIAVLVKKPLGSGRILPEQAIPFIMRQPVSTLVIGGLSLEHIAANLRIAGSGEV